MSHKESTNSKCDQIGRIFASSLAPNCLPKVARFGLFVIMSLVCELVCVYLLGNFGGKIRKFFIPSSGHTGSSDDEGGLVVIYIIRQIILFDRFYLSVRSRLLRRRLKANFRWHIKVLNWRVAGKPKSKQARPVQTITIICAPKKINDRYNKKASYQAAKYFPQGKKLKIISPWKTALR